MKFRMTGGKRLIGKVRISGAKNAIGPLVAASILVKGPVKFTQVPRLSDLQQLLDILKGMGAKVEWTGEHELVIDTKTLDPQKLDQKAMKRMRFSILLLGPMLARFKSVRVSEPGGCSIGNRPIDTHLFALTSLNATIEPSKTGGDYTMSTKGLKGSYIILPEFSVTATENLLMAACFAKGKTQIRLAAAEPHVQDLCHFLNTCGAKIKGIGSHELEVTGVSQLKAPKQAWRVTSDMLEVGTFAIAAALTKGDITMSPADPTHLDAVLSVMKRIGISYAWVKKDTLRVFGTGRLEAIPKIQALIYPGFPTDLQAIFGLLATQCHGTTVIQDPLFESRMGYVSELIKMGANAIVADPHRVIITGPTPLRGTEIRSLDLRAGATMVLAALVAEGETIIHNAELVYRGYEKLDERLRALGADIEVLNED